MSSKASPLLKKLMESHLDIRPTDLIIINDKHIKQIISDLRDFFNFKVFIDLIPFDQLFFFKS